MLKNNRGFTLIEIVAVLIILGIISAVVATRAGNNDVDLAAQTEVIKGHIRYAQTRAMATDDSPANLPTWGVCTNNTGTRYWLYNRDNTIPVPLPGQENARVSLTDVGLTSMTVFDISFNDWGVPFDPTGPLPLSANRSITINDDGDSDTFTIIQQTGFVQ
ncbi:MAG: type II secretion system protein [Desulfobacterium sp.]|nr:type II secretion system protein [Desulfobacterium sp.]